MIYNHRLLGDIALARPQYKIDYNQRYAYTTDQKKYANNVRPAVPRRKNWLPINPPDNTERCLEFF